MQIKKKRALKYVIAEAKLWIADPALPDDERRFWQVWLDRTRREFPELFPKGEPPA